MQLRDQIALVTGGSRGIGRGIVEAFAREGARVAFVYHSNKAAADELVAHVTGQGGTILAIQGDVADPAVPDRVFETMNQAFGEGIDILVNNAGVIRDGLFVRMAEEDWMTVINTNLNGMFRFTRIAAERMFRNRKRPGKIIGISSVAADHVNVGQVNYSASKGAMNSFTRALARELASRGITVNAIAPGFIGTELSKAVLNLVGDKIEKLIPAKRVGTPEDIAAMAVFLASPAASYITGQIITVDGGLSLGVPSL